jgi:hypothetical protein
MAKTKQYVFSARTTDEGLKQLNELKGKLHIGWDEIVIDGMCGHYKLEKVVLSLPKKEKAAVTQEAPINDKLAEKGPEAYAQSVNQTVNQVERVKKKGSKKKGNNKENNEIKVEA